MFRSLGSCSADNFAADLAVETQQDLNPEIAARIRFGGGKPSKVSIQSCIEVNKQLIKELDAKIKLRKQGKSKSQQNKDKKLIEFQEELADQQKFLVIHQEQLARL